MVGVEMQFFTNIIESVFHIVFLKSNSTLIAELILQDTLVTSNGTGK